MLNLVTGQPGNGKTLWTLQHVEAMRNKTQRPVYQAGISGLSLPWLELKDPREWHGCPEGSVIVIDEAWKAFPVRKQGAAVPQYIEEFAVHRHKGFDIFLVTQHRHQVDTFVRKMVGRHVHLVRKFGAERARVYQWEKETDPGSTKEQEVAIKTDWEYPVDVYAWYKSAEVHTVKKDFPWRRFWWLPLLVVAVVVGVYWSVHRLRHMAADGLVKPAVAASGAPVGVRSGSAREQEGVWSRAAANSREASVPGSAPRYDAVYKFAEAPRIVGCMKLQIGSALECRCADQAGAEVDVSVGECTQLVRRGVFDPSRKYGDAKQENIAYLEATRSQSQVAVAGADAGQGSGGATQKADSGS